MICPHCRAQNPESASRCSGCGVAFPAAEEGATLEWKDSPAIEPGSDFGPRYHVESLIGQGGMGRVYKAYDKELDRTVAIKLLWPGRMADPDALQRFKQELLLASKISHKNILRIHDLGDVGGVKFISMAYVEGEDLHSLLKKQGRLPVDRALAIARQLCEALEAAHAEGVVHRDLKPQNVLTDRSGNVYISDFGLAKSLDSAAAGMTRSGEFLGTPRYMSPEQVEGKPVDHRTDLYALGLILYEMVTGDAPFTGDTTAEVMYQRVKQKPKNPKLLNPQLPDHLARIILRCLENDAAQRYQYARLILADLEAGRAPATTRSLKIPLPALSRRGWLATAIALPVLVLLAFAIPVVRHSLFRRPSSTAAVLPGVPPLSEGMYVAVLPFRVLGDPMSLGYVADGLVEALSAKLFQLKNIRMASPAASAKADLKAPPEKIARRLGVNLVVQGVVQGTKDKIRVIVNLEDVVGGRRLWSQEFSGMAADLLTMEDQIYSQLVAALELRPSTDELARAGARPTENVEAYDLYLRGRNSMRGQQQVKNIEAAVSLFEQALKKDSGFALAYTGLADASLLMYREKKDSFWSQKALAAAEQARQLNDNLAEVHFSLGSTYNATGRAAQALAELKRALELAPNSDEGYRRLGAAFLASGRSGESIQAYRKAVEINPYYWVNYNSLGNAYFRLGEYEGALSAFRRMTELEPDNAFGYVSIGSVYLAQGKYAESIPPFQKAIELQPYWATYSNLGTAHFYLKRYDEAVKMFEKAVEMNPDQAVITGNLADAYRWSGQSEKARASYDKAIALAYKELQVNPRNASIMGSLALYYAKKGEAARGLEFIRRARSIDRAAVSLMYNEAVVDNLASRPKDAIQALRAAFQKGYPVAEAKNDPELNSLQTNPEFEKLAREFGRKSN